MDENAEWHSLSEGNDYLNEYLQVEYYEFVNGAKQYKDKQTKNRVD